MPHYAYLIVGGGMTADAAARGIRSVDEEGSVGLITREPDPPYDRPPLSKGLWTGRTTDDAIWRETGELRVDLHLDREVVRIDREERTVKDDRGVVYSYDSLLFATGATPRTLADAVPQVNYLRSYRDYRRLREDAEEKQRFAVIGGGFIGSEIAAALASIGKDVTVLFPEEGLCRRVLPESLAGELNDLFRERGVDVLEGRTVASIRRSGEELLIATEEDGGRALRVDSVVAGVGVEPETLLAENSGLEVDDGIVVDASLRTEDSRIFAAGDCAAFWSPALGRRMRVEHEDHANASGMHAGRCMAGELSEYDHLPYFYSDLFDFSYEAVGTIDPESHDVIEEWQEPGREGTLYYVRDGRIRGVLLWNVRGKLREARDLVRNKAMLTVDGLPEQIGGTA